MTRILILGLPVAAAALLALTPAGPAQDNRPKGPDRGSSDRAAKSDEQQVSGKVVRSKLVDVRGSDQRELVVLVRTDSGREQIVDLGPSQRLKDVKVKTGETISARGRTAKLGKYQVLMATRVTANDKTVNIDRGQKGKGKAGERPDHGYPVKDQTRRVSGQIFGLKKVNLRDSDETHTVARILSLATDKYHVVDLGPSDDLKEFGLRVGDQIEVQGRDILVDGRPVMLAFRMTKGRTTTAINRSSVTRPDSQESKTSTGRQELSDDTVRVIQITAEDMRFNPATIITSPGKKLEVILTNKGTRRHNIEFELPDGEVELSRDLLPGMARGIRFTAPEKTGTYTFYCPVDDHKERGMTGKLIVK